MGQVESEAPPVRASTTSCLVQPNYTRFEPPFADLAVFGDTLSDVGNSYMMAPGARVPGFKGRFTGEVVAVVWATAELKVSICVHSASSLSLTTSLLSLRSPDGLTWIEYVQRHLGLPEVYASMNGGTNYAYGGATTSSDFIHSLDGVPSVSEQVDEYLQSKDELSPDTLHVIMAGRSDYLRYVEAGLAASDKGTGEGSVANHTHVYFTVASEVIRQVQRLHDAGGRQFLVGNVPNSISRGKDEHDVYDTLLFGHNAVLSTELEVSSAELDSFQQTHSDTTIYYIDVDSAFGCIDEHSNELGFTNVVDPCRNSETEEECSNPFNYKYWDDGENPTTHVHHYLSQVVLQAMYEREELADCDKKKKRQAQTQHLRRRFDRLESKYS